MEILKSIATSFPSIVGYRNGGIETSCLGDIGSYMFKFSTGNSLAENERRRELFGNGVIDGVGTINSDAINSPADTSSTDSMNYLKEYQNTDAGKDTTSMYIEADGHTHRNNYGKNFNLYYDDNDTLTNKFFSEDYYSFNQNPNSIIKKTKSLFECGKMKTIISRFHTDNDENINELSESAKTEFGLSHGRNLLTLACEKGGTYTTNGYSNPYCRVWTYHHKYSEYRGRMMRPFTEEKDGEFSILDTVKLNTWRWFNRENSEKWGWRKEGAENYKYSVLNHETGTLNIAPKYLGGGEKNIHPKDCMFSIENLAWQGYDPYSFEKALSWEQRGPFGGRIMWFPPYGLRFNEDTQVSWNKSDFIGRGESVYTYTNTSRSGTLEFMMVVDHPSIIDYATWHNPTELKDTDIHRFFAGCDYEGWLSAFTKPTPLTDEYTKEDITDPPIDVVENKKPEPVTPPEVPEDEEIELTFYVFYPNNYSGYYDQVGKGNVEAIAYLLSGDGAQWRCNVDNPTDSEVLPINFKEMYKSDGSQFRGTGYEMKDSKTDKTKQNDDSNFIIGTNPNWRYYKSKTYVATDKKWYYRIDGEYKVESKTGEGQYRNTFDQTLLKTDNYQDTISYGLNYNVEKVREFFKDERSNENLYSLAEMAYALANDWDSEGETELQTYIKSIGDVDSKSDRIEKLIEMLDCRDSSVYSVTELHAVGYSNSHGNNKVSEINRKRNNFLAEQRCKTASNWFLTTYNKGDSIKSNSEISRPSVQVADEDLKDVSGRTAKQWRSAKVKLKIKKSVVIETENLNIEEESQTYVRFNDFVEANKAFDDNGKEVQLYINVNDFGDNRERKWYYNEDTKQMILWEKRYQVKPRSNYQLGMKNYEWENTNNVRYDQEYHFFKQLEAKHPHVFKTLKEKVQYFDPAFHSMTPEGFMGRLNFLHQCTRQGDTHTPSDKDRQNEDGWSANNLAFGRPPICVLRLGDFYYQKIVINSINITYDPLVLDLNPEGVGVVPLLANVSISFNFIGGGDLTGPVRRLQNAMSFNYYANGRLYDNRADRIERKDVDYGTMGALGHNTIDFGEGKSYFHNVPKAKKK